MRCSAARVHAEPKVGADVVRALSPDAPKHLNDGNALPLQPVDDFGRGALRGREQDAVDPVFAHAGDEPALATRRLCGVGDKGHPAGMIEGVVNPGRQLSVKRICNLADDQSDSVREPRPQVRRGAVIDIPKRVD